MGEISETVCLKTLNVFSFSSVFFYPLYLYGFFSYPLCMDDFLCFFFGFSLLFHIPHFYPPNPLLLVFFFFFGGAGDGYGLSSFNYLGYFFFFVFLYLLNYYIR
jgi:hypothetical protein